MKLFGLLIYLLVDLCKIVLKNNHLEQRNLSKKSEIRYMRHTTINLFNKYGKPMYFVKKEGSGLNSSISLKNEVWFYKYILRKELPEIRESIPNFFVYDDESKMLILENLYNFETLNDNIERHSGFSRHIIEHLARTIAYIHGTTNLLFHEDYKYVPHFHSSIPYFEKITPEILANNNDAFTEMLEMIHSDDKITQSLESLRNLGKYCLIHGDLKFDNILVSKYENKIPIKLIDWELCGWGNPVVDLGTIMGNYLLLWAKSILLKKNQSLQNSIKNSKITFMELTIAINYFLKIYKECLKGYSPNFPSISISDIIRYSGLVILLFVYSELKATYRLSSKGVLLLSLSKTLLTETDYAMKVLNIN